MRCGHRGRTCLVIVAGQHTDMSRCRPEVEEQATRIAEFLFRDPTSGETRLNGAGTPVSTGRLPCEFSTERERIDPRASGCTLPTNLRGCGETQPNRIAGREKSANFVERRPDWARSHIGITKEMKPNRRTRHPINHAFTGYASSSLHPGRARIGIRRHGTSSRGRGGWRWRKGAMGQPARVGV
jgi:hypothetical protein